MTPLLSIRDLAFSYSEGKRLLQDLNWSIAPGEIHCLVGKNGVGKTTLVRLIIGLLQPQRGDIFFHEESLSGSGIEARAGRIGLALQNPDLQLFAPSVREELSFGPVNLNWTSERREARLSETMELFELEPLVEANPMIQTFGLRKKIALASIYALDPELYLLDEPDWSLDKKGFEQLKNWVSAEAALGKSFIIISHNLEWMAELSTHMMHLTEGGSWDSGLVKDLVYRDNSLATDLVQLASHMKHRMPLTPAQWLEDYHSGVKA